MNPLKITLLLFSSVFLFSSACRKKESTTPTSCSKLGILKNYLGQNDCDWVIEHDGIILEPINLANWTFTYYDGQKFKFSYSDVARIPICQVGNPIELNCLEEQ